MEEKNFNIYEHEKMLEVKKAHPEWVWNRGDTHIILGVPGSLEAFKTPVDPGNSFSPGPGTYGVSSWVYTDGVLHTPEEKDLEELKWEFEDGYLPVVHSYWNAGKIAVHSTLFTDGDQEYSDYQDYFTVELTNISEEAKEIRFFLPVRSFGAAGGELRELSGTLDAVSVNGAVCLYAETPADRFGAVSFAKTQADISVFLRNGELPEETSVEDESTWASGAWLYETTLQPGKTVCYQFICHLHANHWIRQKWLKPLQRPFEIEAKKQKVLKEWQGYLSMELDLPDCRFSDALRCQLTHLYMFTVDHDVRITPISYPLWWLRDGAYVLNALSRGGLFDFSAEACRKLAWKDTFGGFGSEGDGPSDGIWVMSEYYLLSRDQEFLKEMFPHMQRRAELLKQMRRTDKPMKRFTEMVIPKCMLDPNTDLMCLPARDGLIDGRMDHGFPIFWINSFAYLAFKRMAFCARELGLDDREYEQEAQEIREALYRLTEKGGFAHNDRDVNSAFWPGGWAERSHPDIIDGFDRYWREVRFRDGKHCPEPDWTYFEAGQAHNLMLLGERDKAWVSIEWFLSHHTAPGMYTYPEGLDGNTALLWPRTRGWDDKRFVTPHGWTAAEVFHLLRDALVYEKDGALVIGLGIPEEWKDKPFSVKKLPTYFGKADITYDPQTKQLQVSTERTPENGIHSKLPFDVTIVRQDG